MVKKKSSRIKKRKYFTLLYIPHTQKSLSKYKIPFWLTNLVLVLGLAFLCTLTYMVYDYYKVLQDVKRLQYVENINKVQSEKIADLLEKTKLMEEKMEKLNELDVQVRKMVGLEVEESNNQEDKDAIDDQAYFLDNNYERDENVVLALNEENNLSRGTDDRNFRLTDESSSLEVLDSINVQLNNLENNAVEGQQKLAELKEDVQEQLNYLNALPNKWPVQGQITSKFGYRKNPFGSNREFHDGLDIGASYGTSVRAAGKGKVIFAGYKYGYGLMVTISHGYGYVSHYGHNSRLLVKAGDEVEKGDIIAKVGSTGRSTGPHLHFMIDKDGKRIDPLSVLN